MAKKISLLCNVPNAPKAVGPYSPAASIPESTALHFLSGQVGIDPNTSKLIEGGIEKEVEQVFNNIEAVLKDLNSSLDQVIKTTVFLMDLKDFQTMNAIYERRFKNHKPSRSTIQVAGLPLGARVEIECIVAGN